MITVERQANCGSGGMPSVALTRGEGLRSARDRRLSLPSVDCIHAGRPLSHAGQS